MIDVLNDKETCCGCTSCTNACPTGCIEMRPDLEGFLYPEADKNKCIHCNVCDSVCPVKNVSFAEKGQCKSYVVRTKKSDILQDSTSGGFFTPLAQWILENDGIVCGATYDKNFSVIHSCIKGIEAVKDLKNMRGSKYVQSTLGECFSEIRENLRQGKYVCFIGTTCQVNGLKTYLRKDYEKLVLIDLVCHGVPSPKLWTKYLDFQQKHYKSSISNISFRNKTYGYHSGTMKIVFDNRRVHLGSARTDYMLKSFFSEIASRPICYVCPFKQLERVSDFTIYDCWHASELVSGLKDDDRGYTNLIIQSAKGMNLMKKIGELYELYSVETEKAIKLDGIMVRQAAMPNSKRKDFYKGLEEETLKDHIQKYIPISRMDKTLEKLKVVVYRFGLLGYLKKLLKG